MREEQHGGQRVRHEARNTNVECHENCLVYAGVCFETNHSNVDVPALLLQPDVRRYPIRPSQHAPDPESPRGLELPERVSVSHNGTAA